MMKLEIVSIVLPGSLLNARDLTLVREFAEADTAEVEIPHITPLAATAEATVGSPSLELGFLLAPCDD